MERCEGGGGEENRVAALDREGWKVGGSAFVSLRFSVHQEASADRWLDCRGQDDVAFSFSHETRARVLRYGVKPNGERVPRWTW